jgi:hypothetical protein
MPITPVFCCGAECNIAVVGAAVPAGHETHWTPIAPGFISIDHALVRSGLASFRITHTTNSAYLQRAIVGAPTEGVARFAIYFTTLPSVDTRLAAFIPAAGSFVSLRYEVTGNQLVGAFGATGVATTPYPIVTGRWYVVDMKAEVGSGNRLVAVQIMDDLTGVVTDLGSQTTAVAASTISTFRLGSSVSSEIPTVDMYYDDVILSVTLADYPIGDGQVLAFSPARDGTHNVGVSGNFKINNATNITGAETNLWEELAEADLTSAADYLTQNVAAGTEYLEVRPPAELGVVLTPRCLTVLSVLENISLTTPNNVTLKMLSGANTDNLVNNASLGSASHIYFSKTFGTLPGGAELSKNGLEDLLFRFGFSTDVDPIPVLHSIMLEVEYPPSQVEAASYQIPGGRVTLTQRII